MMNSFATSIIKAAEETALERLHSNPEQNRVCGPPSSPSSSLLIGSGSIYHKVLSVYLVDPRVCLDWHCLRHDQ
jgi:hypothetical protein